VTKKEFIEVIRIFVVHSLVTYETSIK